MSVCVETRQTRKDAQVRMRRRVEARVAVLTNCVRASGRACGGAPQEVAHVDFGDDRVVSLALNPPQKMCIVTTAGGAAHGCSYTDKNLTRGDMLM